MGRRKLRAIDLYAGIGGWSLGLSMAGISVVASYERVKSACETNEANNRHPVYRVDLRSFPLTSYPRGIDIVVGSPPCTQFSYSNRGGKGDLTEGLEDIRTFLSVVDHLKPQYWAMENVPRVARILRAEMTPKGALRNFRHLKPSIHLVSMDQFGLPQRRKRCIAGNFDHELFRSYAESLSTPTLGKVLKTLSHNSVQDPIYGLHLGTNDLHDHETEAFLSAEEVRINKASKTHHPIYNAMPFPDRLNAPSRTITATCTRVGRESIVIAESARPKRYRRLTIRERATLQSFPINFQLYTPFYRDKLKMVGNAMPPLIAFWLGQAFRHIHPQKLITPVTGITRFIPPDSKPPVTKPTLPNGKTLNRRRFRFAIPTLHLKSGVRFELANFFEREIPIWRIQFFYGTSKDIRTITLDHKLLRWTKESIPQPYRLDVDAELCRLQNLLLCVDSTTLQNSWAKNRNGVGGPLRILDDLSKIGHSLAQIVAKNNHHAQRAVIQALNGHGPDSDDAVGVAKLLNNASLVTAGILVGSQTNTILHRKDLSNEID